jgi:hypothetical protein
MSPVGGLVLVAGVRDLDEQQLFVRPIGRYRRKVLPARVRMTPARYPGLMKRLDADHGDLRL